MDKVIVKKIINKPIKEVWKSITVLGEMKQWFFENIPDFKAEVGFKTEFVVKAETNSFLHVWEILNVVPEKLIRYSWKYPEYVEQPSFVSFELIEVEDEATEVIIIAEEISHYPQDILEFRYESCKGGWEYFINRLKEFCEKDYKA